ncbi:hypothetical protein [Metallibacterium sp.]|jgi:hypothetical protein|uniref:hypothetical protein n=1 Tax=Metallibacterium sp. TaxID=2940281 RepID=UPI00262283D8|nr:hypothetical protein [Metallibacterium sp.]
MNALAQTLAVSVPDTRITLVITPALHDLLQTRRLWHVRRAPRARQCASNA